MSLSRGLTMKDRLKELRLTHVPEPKSKKSCWPCGKEEKGGKVEEISEKIGENRSSERVRYLWSKARKIVNSIKIKNLQQSMSGSIGLPQDQLAILERPKPSFWNNIMMHPNSVSKKIIDMFSTILILIEIFSTFYIYFVQKEKNYIITDITTFFFCFLIAIKFFSGYMRDTLLLLSYREVAINYLKGYFTLDLLATIPFYLLYEPLYCFRFFRITRFNLSIRLLIYFEEYVLNNFLLISRLVIQTISRLISLFAHILLLTHIMACIWVKLGYVDDGWIELKEEGGYLTDHRENTVYIAGIYWVMTTFTTVGYGDISGIHIYELLYIMGIECCGILLFSVLIGNIGNLATQNYNFLGAKSEELEQWLMQLNKANRLKVLPTNFFYIVEKFFDHYWYQDVASIQDIEFFEYLNPSIKKHLLSCLFRDIRKHFKTYFQPLEYDCTLEIILNMEYLRYEKIDLHVYKIEPIIHVGTNINYVYFLISGTVNVTGYCTCFSYLQLHPGAVFGDIYALTDIPSTYSYWYEEDDIIEVYRIEITNFLNILKQYPFSRTILLERGLFGRDYIRKEKRRAITEYNEFMTSRADLHTHNDHFTEESVKEGEDIIPEKIINIKKNNCQSKGKIVHNRMESMSRQPMLEGRSFMDRSEEEETPSSIQECIGEEHPDPEEVKGSFIPIQSTRVNNQIQLLTKSPLKGDAVIYTQYTEESKGSHISDIHISLTTPCHLPSLNRSIKELPPLDMKSELSHEKGFLDILRMEHEYNSEDETELGLEMRENFVKKGIVDHFELNVNYEEKRLVRTNNQLNLLDNKIKEMNRLLNETNENLRAKFDHVIIAYHRLKKSVENRKHSLDEGL